ncbi:hypothetical protein PR048_029731 [Dryococelus australis]|uniref:DDE-1 domain-containing protein n=1 Tax=Dryococelus australis TaxID=614101 RepID=A0ABQ9GGI0_9NEOP|nr:hypothetical protein PR048_029731 [Dryococelus australis]
MQVTWQAAGFPGVLPLATPSHSNTAPSPPHSPHSPALSTARDLSYFETTSTLLWQLHCTISPDEGSTGTPGCHNTTVAYSPRTSCWREVSQLSVDHLMLRRAAGFSFIAVSRPSPPDIRPPGNCISHRLSRGQAIVKVTSRQLRPADSRVAVLLSAHAVQLPQSMLTTIAYRPGSTASPAYHKSYVRKPCDWLTGSTPVLRLARGLSTELGRAGRLKIRSLCHQHSTTLDFEVSHVIVERCIFDDVHSPAVILQQLHCMYHLSIEDERCEIPSIPQELLNWQENVMFPKRLNFAWQVPMRRKMLQLPQYWVGCSSNGLPPGHKKNNISNPFGTSGIAGKDWLKRFLRRHNDRLSILRPTGTSNARICGFNRDKVKVFYRNLDELFDKCHFPADRVFNVNETGLSIVQNKIPHVVGHKGKRQIGVLTATERSSLMTVIVCMSAASTFVPPMIIFLRTNMSLLLMRGASPRSISACHPSGSSNSGLTSPLEERPVLLVMDGHYSHTRDIKVIYLARAIHVHFIALPPHCTHKINYIHLGPYDIVEQFDVPTSMCKVLLLTGLESLVFSFRTDIFSKTTATLLLNMVDKTLFKPNDNKTREMKDEVQQEQRDEVQQDQRDSLQQDQGNVVQQDQGNAVQQDQGGAVVEMVEQAAPVAGPASATFSPYDISTPTNRYNKCSSQIITSSPYKKDLEVSLKGQASKKKAKVPTKKPDKQSETFKRVKHSIESTSSSNSSIAVQFINSSGDDLPTKEHQLDDTNGECIFCTSKICDNVRGEEWVKCKQCGKWAHVECSGCEKWLMFAIFVHMMYSGVSQCRPTTVRYWTDAYTAETVHGYRYLELQVTHSITILPGERT